MGKAVYPGSFDPVTNGHLDVIRRACALFDEVTVCVMVNHTKHYIFSPQERMDLIAASVADLDNVRVDSYDGLLMDYARAEGMDAVVKGLRSSQDFEFENTMDFYNKRIAPEIETVYLMAEHTYAHVSSSGVRELMAFHGDISGLVPDRVAQAIAKKQQEVVL
jgi:pantetheine-phosphate adenylyltransferase